MVLLVVPLFHVNAWGIPYAAGMAGCKLLFPDRFMGDAKTLVELAKTARIRVSLPEGSNRTNSLGATPVPLGTPGGSVAVSWWV